MLAIVASVALFVALYISHHTWTFVVAAVWEVAGLIWFRACSSHRGLWSSRRRGSSVITDNLLTAAAIALTAVYVFPWPMWQLFGEDVFD